MANNGQEMSLGVGVFGGPHQRFGVEVSYSRNTIGPLFFSISRISPLQNSYLLVFSLRLAIFFLLFVYSLFALPQSLLARSLRSAIAKPLRVRSLR